MATAQVFCRPLMAVFSLSGQRFSEHSNDRYWQEPPVRFRLRIVSTTNDSGGIAYQRGT